MKQTLKKIIRNVKSINGNSLAEFATTTALMATLAATAAPKLSEMSEGTKAEKSRNEIDKIIKQAGNFYQDRADDEGRGRFPGQSKFNEPVGEDYDNTDASSGGTDAADSTSRAHENRILEDLGYGSSDGWQTYDQDGTYSTWVSVFGKGSNTNANIGTDTDGEVEWTTLFGDEVLGSTFQDGHYVYAVVAGGGSGADVYPPVLYVGDVENMTDFNNVLMP
ncbi:MAG: hypothetical protein CMG60_00970 [Candidatus Marinimicrobia bacterium]|nr:hypothetical protein [Candidatus Neomarinimicrobiota bacterium]